MSQTPKLILCDVHGECAWSIVCRHLMDGAAMDWRPVGPSPGWEMFDWLCPECEERHRAGRDNEADLLAVCMDCARAVRDGR
jgi:hypothetical protein